MLPSIPPLPWPHFQLFLSFHFQWTFFFNPLSLSLKGSRFAAFLWVSSLGFRSTDDAAIQAAILRRRGRSPAGSIRWFPAVYHPSSSLLLPRCLGLHRRPECSERWWVFVNHDSSLSFSHFVANVWLRDFVFMDEWSRSGTVKISDRDGTWFILNLELYAAFGFVCCLS